MMPPPAFGKGYGAKGGWTFVKGGGWPGGKGMVPELREDAPDKPEPPASDNLYVKHLPIGVTEDDVRSTFSQNSAEIVELRILRPEFALECAALVRFATEEQAAQARTSLDGTVVHGQTPALYANAQTRQGASKKDHVYLRNVPTNASEEKVEELLNKYGTVKWHKVMRTRQGQMKISPTCAALFEMSSEEEAEKAIAALNDVELNFSDVAPPMKVRYAANRGIKPDAGSKETL